jgi:hypothetical protein
MGDQKKATESCDELVCFNQKGRSVRSATSSPFRKVPSVGSAARQATETKRRKDIRLSILKLREEIEGHMTFHLESKTQNLRTLRSDGVPRVRKWAISKNCRIIVPSTVSALVGCALIISNASQKQPSIGS